jgi:TonB family protein
VRPLVVKLGVEGLDMKRFFGGVSAALAMVLVAYGAPAPAQDVHVIQHPDWVQKPTGDDVARFYPSRAREEYVSGRATIVCDVTAEGALADCKVLRESPAGYGFGEAAVSLGPIFRMSPKRVDGKSVDGGIVTIPIVFEASSERPEMGDLAMVLTRVGTRPPVVAASVEAPDDEKAPIIPCPDGVGMCQGHYFMWDERPTAKQHARLTEATKPARGTTFAICTITSEGLLDGCKFDGDLTSATEKTMREAVGLFRAPYKTADGLATASATVIVEFPWDWLTPSKTEETP